MRAQLLLLHLISAAVLSAAVASPRTHIVDRGESWESIASKWGLYTAELKAANSFCDTLYYGLEIDLPPTAEKSPLSVSRSAYLLTQNEKIDKAQKNVLAGNFDDAYWLISSATSAHGGRAIAQTDYLMALVQEHDQKYQSAYKYFCKALDATNKGDITIPEELRHSLASNRDRTEILAKEEKRREDEERERREKERLERLERQRQRELAAAKEREAAKSQSNAGSGWGWGGGWQFPAWQTPFVPVWNNPAPAFDWNSVQLTMPATMSWDNAPAWNAPVGDFDNGGFDAPSTGNPREQITFSEHTCDLCGGKRTIVDNTATTFGNTGTKYCSDCGQNVPLYHQHIPCPSCRGRGTTRKRDR